jgi:hypothetical protein
MHIDRPRLLTVALALGVLSAACVAKVDDGLTNGAGGETTQPGAGGSGNDGTGGAGDPGAGGTTETGAGGAPGEGGTTGTGGVTVPPGTGGRATGGGSGSGGRAGTGGTTLGAGGAAGARATGGVGGPGTGGASGVGGATATGSDGGTSADGGVDPCSANVTLTGGTAHMSTNASGTASGLNWTIWSNGSAGSVTTYTIPAFSAAWANSGDFLARLGLQWKDNMTYDQFGTITAQFAEKKTGTGGNYSYIGIYGWSINPCIEFYIVEDSYNKMPVNPGSTTNMGTAMIDGGTYTLYTRPTSGTGGSKCSGVSNWTQFYSVRQTARTCGQISISQHFAAWAGKNMTLGKMDQAQLLVEVGGGTGSIDFSVANITTTPNP